MRDLYYMACRVHCAGVALVLAFADADADDEAVEDCYSRFLTVSRDLLECAQSFGASYFTDEEADLFSNLREFFDVVRLGMAVGTEAHYDLIRISTHVYGAYLSTFRRVVMLGEDPDPNPDPTELE